MRLPLSLLALLPFGNPASLFAQPTPLPAGTTITVRTIDAIDSKSAQVGQSFRASLDAPIDVGGKQLAPKGSEVTLRLVESKNAGKLAGKVELTVALASVKSPAGELTAADTSVTVQSEGKGKSSGKKIGFGAAIGAGIGVIAGGGKGAAIGAGAGAAAGTAVAALTGPEVKIASEAILNFTAR